MTENIAEGLKPLLTDIKTIKPDPRNARKHPVKNLDTIKKSLEVYGQRKPIVVNAQNDTIEAGNGLYLAAKELGWSKIAVVYVNDDETTQKAYGLMDNQSALISEWDLHTLKDLLTELDTGDIDMSLTGFSVEEIEDLMTQVHKENAAGVSADFDQLYVYNPKWNKIRKVKFFSIWSYRRDKHKEAVEYFKTVKAECDSATLDIFATKVIGELKSTFGNLKNLTVTHCPRGHSKSGPHFASELAKVVANKTELPYLQVFEDRELKGSSSPRNYYTRNKMVIKEKPGTGIILLDDMASSGTTIEACATTIKDSFIIPLVLIYEDVEGDNTDTGNPIL